MRTFSVILVAVDKSEASDRAVEAARDLARATGGEVRLLHVRERQVVVGKFGGSFELETDEDVESLLDKELAVLREANVKVVPDVRRGRLEDVARGILDVADEVSADVVLMGTRGLSAFGAFMLGSTTYKVLHASSRPVMVVP